MSIPWKKVGKARKTMKTRKWNKSEQNPLSQSIHKDPHQRRVGLCAAKYGLRTNGSNHLRPAGISIRHFVPVSNARGSKIRTGLRPTGLGILPDQDQWACATTYFGTGVLLILLCCQKLAKAADTMDPNRAHGFCWDNPHFFRSYK